MTSLAEQCGTCHFWRQRLDKFDHISKCLHESHVNLGAESYTEYSDGCKHWTKIPTAEEIGL